MTEKPAGIVNAPELSALSPRLYEMSKSSDTINHLSKIHTIADMFALVPFPGIRTVARRQFANSRLVQVPS